MLAKLPLDSPLWIDLDACYSTEQARESLREVVTRSELGEPWEQLRAESLHQGSVYGVTSAAIPHLVELAPALTAEERAELWTEIGFWVTAGADDYDGPVDGVQAGLAAALPLAEAGALETFHDRSGPGDSYFVLACVALAGHRSGGALWEFLAPGSGYATTLTCPDCGEEDEVDGFGDPIGPPCAPPPVPDLAARDVAGWAAIAADIEAADDLFGPGWDGFVRVAATVARAGVPEETPPAAVWCLVAAMVALHGDVPWGRTLARLAGHYECESVYSIGDLLVDEGEPVDAPATADVNGFKPAPGGWPTLPLTATVPVRTSTDVPPVTVTIPPPAHARHADDPAWLGALRDGRTVRVTGDGSVQLRDLATDELLGELYRTEALHALAVVQDDSDVDQVVTVSGELTVDVWSSAAVTGKRSSMAPPATKLAAIGHRELVAVCGLPGRPRTIALADRDGRVSLWTTYGVRLNDPLPPDPAHTGIVGVAALTTADGELVVATATDAALRVWSPATGAVTLLPLDAAPRSLRADGDSLVLGLE